MTGTPDFSSELLAFNPSERLFFDRDTMIGSQYGQRPAFNSQRPMQRLSRAAARFSPLTRAPFVLAHAASSAPDLSTASASAAHPPKMSGPEIRERFLIFFEERNHIRLPSSSLVPEDPTVLLTIAGMLQFKPIFLGQSQRKAPRVTTTQKCVRTNDIENVGVTARHHTFFEMLGNFSFGDYFKKEACMFAWELSTKVFGLPVERVWVSVYEEDEEALAIWRDHVGVAPERIKRMGAEDNFWSSGATGPCGPCSELYYDFHPDRGSGEEVTLEDDSRFIEFYNLVFMQSNRNSEGALEPLASQNIDTGMGLERMAQILQGVSNNYETDLIFPIVQKAAQLAGLDYYKCDETTKTALKVIADHIRAVAYLISDGVTPSNVGRGYIVRRLLRRVVMKGRLLGIKDIFIPAGPRKASRIHRGPLIKREGTFATTLERGQKKLDELMVKADKGKDKMISGADAFLLYDTFGFPLELTQEMAESKGVERDNPTRGRLTSPPPNPAPPRCNLRPSPENGLSKTLQLQRLQPPDGPSARAVEDIRKAALAGLAGSVGSTKFTGYTSLAASSKVVAMLVDGQQVQEATAGTTVELVLDSTPFYAESGGQVADHGEMCTSCAPAVYHRCVYLDPQVVEYPIRLYSQVADHGEMKATDDASTVLMVSDVKKAAGGSLFVHTAEVASGTLKVRQKANADVDAAGRVKVGQQVNAVVDANRRMKVRAHHTATHLLQSALKQVLGADTSQQEAKEGGATAMFGEKYEDSVRVVDVPGISKELCGGTHVSNTSEIGAFKILSESGIASGIRRIEAVVGPAAVEYLNSVDTIVKGVAALLKVKQEEVPERVTSLQSELKSANKEIAELKGQLAVAKSVALAGLAVTTEKGFKILVTEMADVDSKAMQEAAVKLQETLGEGSAVILGTKTEDGKANFVAVFSPEVVKVCGGGGGGKPAQAQAGGKDGSKVSEALELATKTLMEAL
eukprot:gene18802-25348_t